VLQDAEEILQRAILLEEAGLFGGTASKTATFEDFKKSFGAKTGDTNYRPDMDLDKSGSIDNTDFISAASKMDPTGTFITEMGRKTLASQQLDAQKSQFAQTFGLDERRLDVASEQFNKNFDAARAEFLTSATGYTYDPETGEPGMMQQGIPGDPEKWVPLPSFEREQFERGKYEFNKKIDVSIDQFAKQLGLDKKKLSDNQLAILLGFIGQMAQTAGSIYTGKTKDGRTNFSDPTVSSSSSPFGGGVSVGTGGLNYG